MASLNASKKSRFERRLRERWEREWGRKRIIEPEPEQSVATVAAELQAPINELPDDDPRRITFDSIKERVGWVTEYADLPMPKIISNPLVPPDTPWWIDTRDATFTVSGLWLDPPVETKVYIDNQEVATVQRESMFGGRAIEFAEDQAVKPRLNKSLLESLRESFAVDVPEEQPTFRFTFKEYPVTELMTEAPASVEADRKEAVLDAINERTKDFMAEFVLGGTYCKANCGMRTQNQSGYCTTCLDRMAVVGRVPEPKAKTPLVEMRPKRQIQLED